MLEALSPKRKPFVTLLLRDEPAYLPIQESCFGVSMALHPLELFDADLPMGQISLLLALSSFPVP